MGRTQKNFYGQVNWNAIGKRVRKIRENAGLSQKEMAIEFDIAQGTLSKFETGHGNVSVDLLIAIADRFDISIDYIITGQRHLRSGAKEEIREVIERLKGLEGEVE